MTTVPAVCTSLPRRPLRNCRRSKSLMIDLPWREERKKTKAQDSRAPTRCQRIGSNLFISKTFHLTSLFTERYNGNPDCPHPCSLLEKNHVVPPTRVDGGWNPVAGDGGRACGPGR